MSNILLVKYLLNIVNSYCGVTLMKLFLYSIFTLVFFSCSSSNSSSQSKSANLIKKSVSDQKNSAVKKYKTQVIVENEDGQKVNQYKKTGEKKIMFDHKQRKYVESGGWVESHGSKTPGEYLREKSIPELLQIKKTANNFQLTLIIDELLIRKRAGIPALATFLDDTRLAAFPKGREYWWYQKKGKEAEPVSLAVYAAYAIQRKTSAQPKGVKLVLTNDRMFYAIKDGYAVVKEDVQKVWKQWWSLAENDY